MVKCNGMRDSAGKSVSKILAKGAQILLLFITSVLGILLSGYSLKDVPNVKTDSLSQIFFNRMQPYSRFLFSIYFDSEKNGDLLNKALDFQNDLFFENGYTAGAPYMPYLVKTNDGLSIDRLSLTFSGNGIETDSAVITLSTFNNDLYLETLELRLYENRGLSSEMQLDPGLDSVAYISDEMADQILSKNGLQSYSDIIDKYSVSVSDGVNSRNYKIANIYLLNSFPSSKDDPYKGYNPAKELKDLIGSYIITPDQYFFASSKFALQCSSNFSQATIRMLANRMSEIVESTDSLYSEEYISKSGIKEKIEGGNDSIIGAIVYPQNVNVLILSTGSLLIVVPLIARLTVDLFRKKTFRSSFISLTSVAFSIAAFFGLAEFAIAVTLDEMLLYQFMNIGANICLILTFVLIVTELIILKALEAKK